MSRPQDRDTSQYSEVRQRQIRRQRIEAKRRRRRKKRIIRDAVLFGMLLTVILVIYGIVKVVSILTGGSHSEKKAQVETEPVTKQQIKVDTSGFSDEYLNYYNQIKELETQNPDVTLLYEHFDEYPIDVLDIVVKNPETAQFAADYLKNGNITVIPDIDSYYTPGEIPHFLQWDEQWGYSQYGDNMMAVNGCGPTSVSMVAVGLTGNTNYNPRAVADLSIEKGYYSETGTSWELMIAGAAEFGINGTAITLTEDAVREQLNNGNPIIASMGPGDFTTLGHFIVITGIDGEGKLKVNDPNSKIRSSKHWEIQTIIGQAKSMWAYTV